MHVGLIFGCSIIWVAPKNRPKMGLKITSKSEPNLGLFLGGGGIFRANLERVQGCWVAKKWPQKVA